MERKMGTVKPTKKYVITAETRERILELITEIRRDLENAEEVIAEEEYDASVEEMILIAKQMGIL